ncbi:MAG: PQQ-binding-like beta-propeller repeat protein [Pyrinomonadaceae bacterium]
MTRPNLTILVLQIATFFSILPVSGVPFEILGQLSEPGLAKLTKCSTYTIETPVADALATDGERVYLGMSDGRVQALDSNLASSIWRTELGGEIVSNIVAGETGIFVVANSVKTSESVPAESVIRSLSKETGVSNWTAPLPYSGQFAVGQGQRNLSVVSSEGMVFSVDGRTGRTLWRSQAFGKVTARPSFFPHGIAFGTREKQIIIVSPESGVILFKGSINFTPTAVTNPSPEILVVGDERGNVASIDISGGKNIWNFKSGAGISFVSVTDQGLFIASNDNFIYLIWMYNGDVIWKRRLPGRVIEGVTILDGLLTALIYGENSAFLIDSKKGKIVDQLPQSDKNYLDQLPVIGKDSGLLVTTRDSVVAYSLKGCEQKIGKAVSTTPPVTKQ